MFTTNVHTQTLNKHYITKISVYVVFVVLSL
jgi:hypothetical protein